MNGFLGSGILEKAIGIAFLYLLLAVFCTASVEWISGLLAARAGTLRGAISQLLGDQMLTSEIRLLNAFYEHPLVSGGTKGDSEHPSYLSPHAFSTAMLDLIVRARNGVEGMHGCLRDLPDGRVRTSLLAMLSNGKSDFIQLQEGVENWFDDAMHHASCKYQKQTKIWSLTIAIGITIATNADTFYMLRQPGHLPGWASASVALNAWGWLSRLTGWLLTVGAVSLGAPFWFDVLNRFINLRHPGRPHS